MDWQWAVVVASFVVSVAMLVFAALKLRPPVGEPVIMKELEDVAKFRESMQDRMEKMYVQYQGRIDRLEDELKDHMKYHMKDGKR